MPSPIILDSNLAVLLTVGIANQNYIAKHKRLRAFGVEDFKAIESFVAASSGILLTPNVITETSNLIRQTDEHTAIHASQVLAVLVARSEEIFITSRLATTHKDYIRLGITDAVLLTLQASGGTLLTVDLDLYLAAASAGFEVINYNHLRAQ